MFECVLLVCEIEDTSKFGSMSNGIHKGLARFVAPYYMMLLTSTFILKYFIQVHVVMMCFTVYLFTFIYIVYFP